MKKLKIILLSLVVLAALAIGAFYTYNQVTRKTIVVLLYDDFTLLDAVGSYQTLSGLMLRNYSIQFVAKQKGRVSSSYMQSLMADYDFREIPVADILVIPGGEHPEKVISDEETMDWIRKIDSRSDYTITLGSGAVILGSTGALNGKRAAASWKDRTALETLGVQYQEQDYTHDGKYYSGIGASASIDLALGLMNDVDGEWLSKTTQLFIAYDPHLPVNAGYFEQAGPEIKAMAVNLSDVTASKDGTQKTIVMYLYDGFTMLDVTGPYQVFKELQGKGYKMKFVAREKGIIQSDFIQSLVADYSIKEVNSADLLFIPGGSTTYKILNDTTLINWVRKINETTLFTTSVCTGSVLLGKAGLLQGRRATSHWYVGPMLKEFGAIYSNERYTKDGKFITGAGVSSGLDLALFIARELEGEDLAKAIQLKIGYFPNPPFDAGTPEKSDEKTVAMLSKMFEGTTNRGTEKTASVNSSAILLASDIDPVCNMSVRDGYADTTLYEGKIYGFCSRMCKESFITSHRKTKK